MIPTSNGRDDIDTWPGEHYKKTRMKATYKGRLQPPKPQGGEYIYSPPTWQICKDCSGEGVFYDRRINDPRYDNTCTNCNGKGWIPIYYTPQQWQEEGGVLNNDTPCWQIIKQGSDTLFFLEPYGNIKKLLEGIIIIATEAGRPPANWREENGKD